MCISGQALSDHKETTLSNTFLGERRILTLKKMSEATTVGNPPDGQTPSADNKAPSEKASNPAGKPAGQEQEEECDIDLEAPETEKAALAIQSQFRRFQKKKK